MRFRLPLLELLLVTFVIVVYFAGGVRAGDFVNFESAHVHPISLTESGRHLFAVNTPEARVAKFRVTRHGKLRFQGDLPVGLEPVSLAVRPGSEDVWVVNHLSDSVSVVDGHTMTLLATLQVGDEPTDVAFASGRAFVSLAGKEDRVVVYDALSLERITSLEIFGDDPRALAVSPDGTRVALVVLESGNGTTTVHQSQFTPERQPPIPFPARDPIFPPDFGELLAPSEPLIVRFDPERELFTDESGADWSDKVFFGLEAQLPDHDLFWIDATSNPPFVTNTASRVGTTLFDVDIHPKTGEAWVSNTDARNEVRFEPVLRGHLVETRISRVDPVWGSVNHVDLNPHIDRSVTPGPPEEIATSLSAPGDGVFSRSGHRYYLTAFGSAKIAILNGRSGKVLQRIEVGGGPSGLALHPRNKRLYVMQRFSNTIGIVNLKRGKKMGEIGVSGPRAFDPTPSTIRQGRRFLYDAQLSSGHGDISCATCHIFGNFDGLAWDLGDPQGEFVLFEDAPWLSDLATPHAGMDPMKGPMVTQSLRGLLETEPFHWRGDRENFQHFNGAFVSLLGRDTLLSGADMDSFTQFAVNIDYPPNPYRQLDDSLPESIPGHGDASVGEDIFFNVPVSGVSDLVCVDCHQLPLGTSHQVQKIGDQSMEVAHLRNVYEKLGLDRFEPLNEPVENFKSGFGIQHAGASGLRLFLSLAAGGLGQNFADMTAFVVSFSSGTPPCVGRQITFTPEHTSDHLSVLETLVEQAQLGHCDLIANGRVSDTAVGFVFDPVTGQMLPDSVQVSSAAPLLLVDSIAQGGLLTFMGVPSGSGQRLGIDRDRDGCYDGDELRLRTDPANPGTQTPDADKDGLPDATDLCPGWVQQDHRQQDRDGNGIPNECECGDISNDGLVNWLDFRLLWLQIRGYGGRFGLALNKCNVSGEAGNDPELCTRDDLRELGRFLWTRAMKPRSDHGVLEPRCLPEIVETIPVPTTCVDEALYHERR